MPPYLKPFLFLILPQIISPVTTRQKKSSLRKSQKFGFSLRELVDTPLRQATLIATEVNYCIARCSLLR